MLEEKEVGKNIRRMREDNGLSQEQLANKLGVTRKAVSAWEVGRSYPKMGYVNKMCEMFGCRVSDFTERYVPDVARWGITAKNDDFPLEYLHFDLKNYKEDKEEQERRFEARMSAYEIMLLKMVRKINPDQQAKLLEIACDMAYKKGGGSDGNEVQTTS